MPASSQTSRSPDTQTAPDGSGAVVDDIRATGRKAVAIDMTPCLGHLPCLAEARHASEGDDAIPADQFLMLAAADGDTPLFLAPGRYRLRLLGSAGMPVAGRELEVPNGNPDLQPEPR